MILKLLKKAFYVNCDEASIPDAPFEPYHEELFRAGLSEAQLRQMDPDERVAALEEARLDPYDYIYLAC